jgi:molybdenum ABC transporter molybdate-binding protein
MTADSQSWKSDWSVGLRTWVARAGRTILGKGRLELLEGIDRWNSISAAARQMGMSYRRAWLLVQSINEAAGEPLVEAIVGGSHGGGARLTAQGRLAVAVFRELQTHLQGVAAATLSRLVQPADGTPRIHLAAAASLEEVLGQLLADYALRQPSVSVRTIFGASDELANHILAGSPVDLFLVADARPLDRLEAAGLVEPGSRVGLVGNTLAAVGSIDQTVPVHKPADLLQDRLRIALADASSPLGGYTRAYLQGLGLYEALLPRAVRADNARAVVAAVRGGQADVGLVYGSDAVLARDCRVLFRAARSRALVRYSAVVLRQGQQHEQAQALLTFLTSGAALRRFRSCGFLPIPE